MITPNENIAAENRLGTAAGSEMFWTTIDKPFARVSWGAIFAGALTSVATLLILSLLGLGIGLSTLNPATGDNPSGTAIGIGAVVWWIISSIIAMYVGGFIAGRLAGNFNGYIHGLVTWSAVTLLTMMLLGSAVGRAFSGASGLAQFAAQTAPIVQSQAPALQSQAQDTLNRLQGAATSPQNRAQAEQTARDVGEKAAKGGAMGAFGAVIALLLGAGAATYGGMMGKRGFIDAVPERKDFLRTTSRV